MNNNLDAILLCGGRGERLRPLTQNVPKPLIKIDDQPILSHQIKFLLNSGINKIIIATGYKSRSIEKFVSDNFNNRKITVVNSGDVDILVRIKKSISSMSKNFLVCYGDTLADVNINELFQFHNNHSGKATVTSYQLQSQFGVLGINYNGLVENFKEKPKLDAWINIGYFIFKKDIIKGEYGSCEKFEEFLFNIAKSQKLYSYKHRGIHITVNTISELEKAKKDIKYFKNDKK